MGQCRDRISMMKTSLQNTGILILDDLSPSYRGQTTKDSNQNVLVPDMKLGTQNHLLNPLLQGLSMPTVLSDISLRQACSNKDMQFFNW